MTVSDNKETSDTFDSSENFDKATIYWIDLILSMSLLRLLIRMRLLRLQRDLRELGLSDVFRIANLDWVNIEIHIN